MIRRDYILRQIERFVATLVKIAGLTKAEQWQEASVVTTEEFQRLTGMDAAEVARLFYQRLLGLDDAALSEGNLPRAEVKAGLADLDARLAWLRRTAG